MPKNNGKSYLLRLEDQPFTGFFRELIMLGWARLIESRVDIFDYHPNTRTVEIKEENYGDFVDYLKSANDHFEDKIGPLKGRKIFGNDKRSYKKPLKDWFSINRLPDTYIDLFLLVIDETAELIKNKKLNPITALRTMSKSAKGTFLGDFTGDKKDFITPSIIKQLEYYEKGTEFLRPSWGDKEMIRLDPLWFSLLALGILTAYAGYEGGKYYFFTKPDLEFTFKDDYAITDTIRLFDLLTTTNLRSRHTLEINEVYEMNLALNIAKQLLADKGILSEKWLFPIRLYGEEIMGRNYVATSVYDLDLGALIRFFTHYLEEIKMSAPTGSEIVVKFKVSKTEEKRFSPLEAILYIAEKNLTWRSIDNEQICLLMVKDLYKAINSNNLVFFENTIYRLLRKNAQYVSSNSSKAVNYMLKSSLSGFSRNENIDAIIKGIQN
ncbi:MAG: type I-A CRISPR-associated protein Cas8a2/Csx9 [Candidatus Heimdallarchaeota archaeon]|nr:type I-A CRISPR-associated protein Cas8a2/Csx9 [Candidatus Heimdallarchaeota archaeon]